MTKAKQDKDNTRKTQDRTRKPFDVDDAVRKYEAGTHKLRDLAKDSGYCYGTVRRRLLEAGVTLDKPGGNRRKRKSSRASDGATPPQEGDAG